VRAYHIKTILAPNDIEGIEEANRNAPDAGRAVGFSAMGIPRSVTIFAAGQSRSVSAAKIVTP